MPTPTYTAISSQTLSSTATSVTFSSLSGYRDYRIIVFTHTNSQNIAPRVRFNGDTGLSWNSNYFSGDGGFGSGSPVGGTSSGTGSVSLIGERSIINQSILTIDILDAHQTDKDKIAICRASSVGNVVSLVGARATSSSAVNSISILLDSGTFSVGSVFSLYGIAG